MQRVHFLNVGDGDCSIIQHESRNVSVVDICNGNSPLEKVLLEKTAVEEAKRKAAGNFHMREYPTQPLQYLRGLSVPSIFRFILTHPDMDHLDGFRALSESFSIWNFWDSGARKTKPSFSGGKYLEDDWDRYVAMRDGTVNGTTIVRPKADARFKYANQDDNGGLGDYLEILAPTQELIAQANKSGDFNDASYVLVYHTAGGRIIFAGDSHDSTWEHVLRYHLASVSNCAVLIAPHHGRHSDRDFSFLDAVKPVVTLFGCADSKDLAYSAWTSRSLLKITNNQAGNIILDAQDEGIDIYVENATFAQTCEFSNLQAAINGCVFYGRIKKP